MVRASKREKGSSTNMLSGIFYPVFNKLSDYRFEENASDFFLISKRVADVLRSTYRERNRFLRGYIQVMGFDKTTLSYKASERKAGTSKYSKRKLFNLAIAAISSFSKKPLYFALAVAGIFSALSLILAIYSIYMFFFGDNPPSGYTTLVVFMSVCFTMVYLILAIMSIYIGFSFDEVKDRPIYLVKESKTIKHE
jgi:dolichol-phosphate mannosyltransferase